MANKSIIPEVIAEASNRRSFVRKLGLASAAAGAAAMVTGKKLGAQASYTDLDILNFALNLEYLEAEFYTVATTGQYIEQVGIGVTGSGNQGATTGGAQVAFSNTLLFANDIALEIANDERTHVTLLRTAIAGAGLTPAAKPAINLAALGLGFASQAEFLTLARIFEDIGVTAYAGAAPLIVDKNYLGVAARILAAEAEHTANIRLQVARARATSPQLDSVDVVPPPSGTRFFSLDANALSAIRTPGQVLYLAFGNQANVAAGGFFPNGVNGTMFNLSSAPPAPAAAPAA